MNRLLARAALLTMIGLPGPVPAAPSFEYAPEAEIRFRERCRDAGGADSACQRLMERLQAELGYAAFLDRAAGGPLAFGRLPDRQLAGTAWYPPAR